MPRLEGLGWEDRASTFDSSYPVELLHSSSSCALPTIPTRLCTSSVSFADINFIIMPEFTLQDVRRLYMISALYPKQSWEYKKVAYDGSADEYGDMHRSVTSLKSYWNLHRQHWGRIHLLGSPPSTIPNVCIRQSFSSQAGLRSIRTKPIPRDSRIDRLNQALKTQRGKTPISTQAREKN